MKKRDFTTAWRALALLGSVLPGGCVEVTEAAGLAALLNVQRFGRCHS